MKKLIVSVFVVLNISAVLFVNRPRFINALYTHLPYSNQIDRFYGFYSFFSGLNARWQMFGGLSHFIWHYEIKAKSNDNKLNLLPLPRQSQRNFWQRTFFDFKEAKFHLNMYRSKNDRANYASFLCREFPFLHGSKTESIVFELHFQKILPRPIAVKNRDVYSADSYSKQLDDFPCP